MALPGLDSSVGSSFGLEFDGVVIRQITEVGGLKIDQDEVTLTGVPREADPHPRGLRGR